MKLSRPELIVLLSALEPLLYNGSRYTALVAAQPDVPTYRSSYRPWLHRLNNNQLVDFARVVLVILTAAPPTYPR